MMSEKHHKTVEVHLVLDRTVAIIAVRQLAITADAGVRFSWRVVCLITRNGGLDGTVDLLFTCGFFLGQLLLERRHFLLQLIEFLFQAEGGRFSVDVERERDEDRQKRRFQFGVVHDFSFRQS